MAKIVGILTVDEIVHAAGVGIRRRFGAIERGHKGWGKRGEEEHLFTDIYASSAEYYGAIIHDIPWEGHFNVSKVISDLAGNIEIRSSTNPNSGLRFRAWDIKSHRYGLVTVNWPKREFTYHGWMWGYEINNRKYYDQGDEKEGKPPCCVAPQEDLHQGLMEVTKHETRPDESPAAEAGGGANAE